MKKGGYLLQELGERIMKKKKQVRVEDNGKGEHKETKR